MALKLFILLLALSSAAGITGCSSRSGFGESAFGQKKHKTPEEAFAYAKKLHRKKYYEQTIEELDRLRNTFPFSTYAIDAELLIADTLLTKGAYIEAAGAFESFAKLHPNHKKTDYALFQVGNAYFKDAPKSIDRDQSSTDQALRAFQVLLQRYPNS